MPDIRTIDSDSSLFEFLRELEHGEETFADFRSLRITVAREESHGHVIVGSGKTRDGGGVIPLNFTLKGLINAVRDLSYLSTLTTTTTETDRPE